MASLRWALCLAALIATTHLGAAQITGSNAREATMRAREGGQAQSSLESSSGGRSSGQSANTFGTLGTVGGVAGGASSQGGLIGMGGSGNSNPNGGSTIGNLNGNSNGAGTLISGNGNSNGNSNIGNKNGNDNGNGNQNGGLITGVSGGSGSGNLNGNSNTGNKNGNGNGNGNVLGGSGNSNGNGNTGNNNGNGNGNGNTGSNNGNGNGNGNTGSNNGNGNGNGNTGSNNGNGNGNGNTGSNNGNGNGNGNTGNGNGNNNGNGNGCARTGKNTCGSGSNDPIMTGFTGRAFNFFGDVGKTYNLISSMNHQLAARLKLSVMSDHNGTTMDGVGFMFKSYRVLFELEGDSPHVYINDKELSPRKKKQKHAWRFEDGSAVEMSWDPYTPGIGNAIVVATDVLKVMVWHTPKGIIDEGGQVLEGYVNFNITLMAPPEDDRMAGIIGETYERFTVGQEAFNPNSTYFLPEDQVWHGKGLAEDYEMVNYWDTKFPMNLFGTNRDVLSSRSALEMEPVAEVAEEADRRLDQPQPLRLRRLLLA